MKGAEEGDWAGERAWFEVGRGAGNVAEEGHGLWNWKGKGQCVG